MSLLQTGFVIMLASAGVLSTLLAGMVLRIRNSSHGQRPFALLLLLTSNWALTYLFELISPSLEVKTFWVNIEYISIAAVPLVWFIFSYRFTGVDLGKHAYLLHCLLGSIPALTILFSFWNPGGIMRFNLAIPPNGFGDLVKEYGWWFWVHATFSYSILAVGSYLLLRGILSSNPVFRSHRLLAVLASFLPWIGNILYITGLVTVVDLSPVAFSLSGLIMAWGFFRLRLLDVVPVASEMILANLEDAIMVVDPQKRIVELNPSGRKLLGLANRRIIGSHAQATVSQWTDLRSLIQTDDLPAKLISQFNGNWYDMRAEPVLNSKKEFLGRIVVIRDFTALHEAEERLREVNLQLEERISQRTAELSEELSNRRRAEKALHASEERYALAARGSAGGLFDWDVRSGSVYYAERWADIFGLPGGEMIGSIHDWYDQIHHDDVDRVRMEVENHLTGKTGYLDIEHRTRREGEPEQWVQVRGQAIFDADRLPMRLAGSSNDITQQKESEKQLVFNALHDVLTGLANRTLFVDRVDQAIFYSKSNPGFSFALLNLDIDRFKMINDEIDRKSGDQLLVEVARRLEGCARPIDTSARLGGDEFALLLNGISSQEVALNIADCIMGVMNAPFQLGDKEISLSVSIGVVFSSPEYSRAEEITFDADLALYQAKMQGRKRFEVFQPELREYTRNRLEIETNLRQALKRKEFSLVYQPILQLEDQTLSGFEALLRWTPEGKDPIPPVEFIPVAEDTGLILPIGRWVMEQACQQLMEWSSREGNQTNLEMSVNVSARQISAPDFVSEVRGILAGSGLPAHSLNLELTESLFLEGNDGVTKTLEELRRMGVGLHMDDFGTGFSSLGYLGRYQVDTLKIDRSFVHGLTSENPTEGIVRTILSLAEEMQMEVVAEGIETEQQKDILRELGCQFGQGYLLGKPLPAVAAEEFLTRRNGSRPEKSAPLIAVASRAESAAS